MRLRVLTLAAVLVALAAAGCGASTAGDAGRRTLTLGAIPDQYPEPLARL